ncbi:MAG: MobP3 family relaxase [Clostridia bacterium]
MAKLIFKCKYIKGGNRSGARGSNLVNYMATREGVQYIDYISNRTGVEKIGKHGLFSSGNSPVILSKAMDEIKNHEGNIWMPIFSLKREDADATGFNSAKAWKDLISKEIPKLAKNYKININNLKWYAAYHDHPEHPHCHMVIFSENKNEGYLSEKSIENIKSDFVKEIFQQQMLPIYQEQTLIRDELKAKFKENLSKIDKTADPNICDLMLKLKMELTQTTGKKTYGYLRKPVKKLVDEIVNELGKNESIDKMYDGWLEMANLVNQNYTDKLREKRLFSEEAEFKSIKNMIIKQADSINLEMKQESHNAEIATAVISAMISLAMMLDSEVDKMYEKHDNRMDRKAFIEMVKREQAIGHKVSGMSY